MLALPVAYLSCIGSVHSIQSASDAFVSDPRNVRRVSKAPFPIKDEINEAVCNFDFWGNVKQFNHRVHVCSLMLRGGIVTKCKPLQTNIAIMGPTASIMKALKRLHFSDVSIQTPASVRGLT